MAGFNKKAINIVGGAASAILLLGTIAYGVLPQLDRADDYSQQSSEIDSNIEMNQLRLVQLSEYANNPEALEANLANTREAVPDSSDVPGIQRAVVENLGGLDLISFSHGQAEPFSAPVAPALSLSALPEPFTASSDGDGNTGSSSTADEENGEETEEDSGGTVNAVPIVVQVEGGNTNDIANFLGNLENDDRLMLVIRSAISITSDGEDGEPTSANTENASATIHFYAFSSE